MGNENLNFGGVNTAQYIVSHMYEMMAVITRACHPKHLKYKREIYSFKCYKQYYYFFISFIFILMKTERYYYA